MFRKYELCIPYIDDPIVGEKEDANVNGFVSFTLETETGMKHLSMPLPMEEVPAPENTIDVQSDDHFQAQNMLFVFCHCI